MKYNTICVLTVCLMTLTCQLYNVSYHNGDSLEYMIYHGTQL
jgi:hypothetical protein